MAETDLRNEHFVCLLYSCCGQCEQHSRCDWSAYRSGSASSAAPLNAWVFFDVLFSPAHSVVLLWHKNTALGMMIQDILCTRCGGALWGSFVRR